MYGIAALSLGLSADAFAASLTVGASCGCKSKRAAVSPRILFAALVFGAFQALMPLTGWLASVWFAGVIEPLDHWIAFALLEYIAIKMLIDAFKNSDSDSDSRGDCGLSVADILILGIATSIDALAAGVSLTAMDVSPLKTVCCIGVVTAALSLVGGVAGGVVKSIGCGKVSRAAKTAKLVGAGVLALTGVRVLAEHLMAG